MPLLRLLPWLLLAGCRAESTLPSKLPDRPGLHHLIQVTSRIYSGAEPHGEESFATLRELGVTRIVSVDGIVPDVETARKYGIRYSHIPIGYDGIPASAQQQLAWIAQQNETVYVHCHHGKHRGPTAAAVLALAGNHLQINQARQILELAETAPEYAGLWRTVAEYRRSPESLHPPPETAIIPTLAARMATLDRDWDDLKRIETAGWSAPTPGQPPEPLPVAALVKEHFREAVRELPSTAPPGLITALKDSETLAADLEARLRARQFSQASESIRQLDAACKQCHRRFRN